MGLRDDSLPGDLRQKLIDRFEGWEIVEFLRVDVEDVLDAFEEVVLDHLADLLEEGGISYGEEEE
jgi:hypothetical protein